MPLEESDYLIPECSGPMVLLLIADIGTRLFNSRNSDAESAIAFLPGEAPQRRKGFVNPFR
jgi:hypothetical protein